MSKIVCDECDNVIGVDAVIPSEAWEAVANGDYALCVPCLDQRLQKANIKCPAYLLYRSPAMDIDIPETIAKAVMDWRPSQTQVDRDGTIGIPALSYDSQVWKKEC